MSQPGDEKRSDNIVGGDDSDGDDDALCGKANCRKKTKVIGNLRKAKRVALFRFRKKRIKGVSNPPPSSTAGCLGKRVGGGRRGGVGGGFACCFKQTLTLDSPVEPQTSDPNSPEFTFGLLKALIEKNDFHSKECNPHFDIPDTDAN